MRPLIIQAALNELMDKASNPHVPYGPEEVAIDAAACVEAGASMLHFHARDAQTGDQLWTSTETYVDALRRIYGLGVARDVLFYPTYEWLTEEQLTHVVALRQHPDVRLALAALDVGAVLLNEFDAATSTFERADWGKVFTHEQTVWFLELCRSHGLRPYSGCAEPGHLRHLLAYRDMGLLDPPLVLKFFTAEHAPYGLPPGAKSVHTYAGLLDELMVDTERVWFVHCYGAAILPMAAEAIALGGHVRIGLGDETFDDTKPTNAELVARVVKMARSAGRSIATPQEARSMMGLEA
jgi:3-keto-5-aminohexanoate cleavage enzyme